MTPSDRVIIRGGFFWLETGVSSAAIEQPLGVSGVDVSDCAFMTRPRWWQLRQWRQALRVLRQLPTADVGARLWLSDGPHDHFLADGPNESGDFLVVEP